MSTAPKGYPSNQKLDRVPAEYASVVPVSSSQSGLSVAASLYVYSVGTDAVDAGSTTSNIVAAGIGSVARVGDIIRFTSGAMDGYEGSVISTSTNSVTLGENLSAAPAALDTFSIFRFIHPVATSGGGVAAALSYTLNGVSAAVTEDTVTPANNRPLPVKISGVTMANPPIRNVYSVTPVTTGAYVEMVAFLTATAQKIQIFDSSGETLIFAVGAAGAENPIFYITPGGIDICVNIVAGSRIAIKALSANCTVGEFVMNITT
jgi:hypothetical protein